MMEKALHHQIKVAGLAKSVHQHHKSHASEAALLQAVKSI